MKYLIFLFFLLCLLSCQTTQEGNKEEHQISTDTSAQKIQQKVFMEEREEYQKSIYFGNDQQTKISQKIRKEIKLWWGSIPPKARKKLMEGEYKVEIKTEQTNSGNVNLDEYLVEERVRSMTDVLTTFSDISEENILSEPVIHKDSTSKSTNKVTITLFKEKKYYERIIYFENKGQTKISDKDSELLYKWWHTLSTHTRKQIEDGKYKVSVTGYATDKGTIREKRELGLARAMDVRRILMYFTGLPESKIDIRSYGEMDAPKDRDKARKVIVKIIEQ